MNIFNSICNFKIKACIFGTVLAVLSGTPHSYATQPKQYQCALTTDGKLTVTRSVFATICKQCIQKKNCGHGDNHFMPMTELRSFLHCPRGLQKNTKAWIHSMLISTITPKNIIYEFIRRYENDTKHKFTFWNDTGPTYKAEIYLSLDKSFFNAEPIYLAISNIDNSDSSDSQLTNDRLYKVKTQDKINVIIVFKGLTRELDPQSLFIATVYPVFEETMFEQQGWDLMEIRRTPRQEENSIDNIIMRLLREVSREKQEVSAQVSAQKVIKTLQKQVDPEQPAPKAAPALPAPKAAPALPAPPKAAPAHMRQQMRPMYSQAPKRKK